MTPSDWQFVVPGDLVILNNPHNPTGACASRAAMLDCIRVIRHAGGLVLADEAFIDYAPHAAITRDAVTDEGILAVRSLTKFYGCAGLRVGYAVGAAETISALGRQMSAWPVTTLALNTLASALGDDEYIRSTLERNREVRRVLLTALTDLGCYISPPGANFLLVELPAGFRAADIRARLIREHAILVRECDSFDGLPQGRYLRVAVRTENENARLVEAMAIELRNPACLNR